MPGDVEMSAPEQKPTPELIQLDSRSPSPPRQSPITVDDSSVPSTPLPTKHTSQSAGPSNSGVEDTAISAKEEKKKSKAPPSARPSSSAAGAKPKSTKAPPRSPSPSPPPPPARPQLQTIRLEIKLGGPEHYEVDISSLSKASGQRPPTPVPASKRDSSDDSHSEGDDEGDGKLKDKKRRKKKNIAQEYYDVSDPFIDDSELAVDERTYFAQTKQQGFYVSSGQVALLTDKPPAKKPKSKKTVNILAPSASISAALSAASLPLSLAPLSISAPPPGTSSSSSTAKAKNSNMKDENGSRDAPIALYEEGKHIASALKRKISDGEGLSMSAASPLSSSQNSKKKRKVEIQPFHPELEELIEQMKVAINSANWDTKGKFPPELKPMLSQVALKAIILGEYDDNFFNLMPRIFPYNKFTMTKLIKRTIWREHTNLLSERTNVLLVELAALAEEGFSKAQEEYEKGVATWEKRQERAKAEPNSGEEEPAPSDVQHTPNTTATSLPGPGRRGSVDDTGNDTGVEHDESVGAAGGGKTNGKNKEKDALTKDASAHPPAKKYRLTDTMKGIIWQLVCLSNECCRIENEKNQLENNNQVVSDQGVRKQLYQRIVAAFPDGWITSGQVSREVSVMKKKYEKEVMEGE
ncbi:hypothetical protein EW026_g7052 [Hermanssonia centrifuga]|uniref:Ubinuclein middle domain-containing protein n=1 Tax=Hermanssonia centrifuga TaxID=98765 RepID=A0A4S4KA33_9APHY|nr:hypothetical protein EW026_g7052 [Hermanssonia centrifuga]